jgi:hypothetical protein
MEEIEEGGGEENFDDSGEGSEEDMGDSGEGSEEDGGSEEEEEEAPSEEEIEERIQEAFKRGFQKGLKKKLNEQKNSFNKINENFDGQSLSKLGGFLVGLTRYAGGKIFITQNGGTKELPEAQSNLTDFSGTSIAFSFTSPKVAEKTSFTFDGSNQDSKKITSTSIDELECKVGNTGTTILGFFSTLKTGKIGGTGLETEFQTFADKYFKTI